MASDPHDDAGEGATPAVAMAVAASASRSPCLLVLSGPRVGELIAFDSDGGIEIGRDPGAGLHLLDEGVSRRHCRVSASPRPGAGVEIRLSDLGSTNGTWVGKERVSSRVLGDGERFRVGQTTVIRFVWQDAEEQLAHRRLLDAALRDPVTAAFNRRYFLDRLADEVRLGEGRHAALAVLCLNVDRFEFVNRLVGRELGDGLLRRLVDAVAGALRADDVVARLADDTFAVLAPGTHHESGRRLGERLRGAVADALFEAGGAPVELRVSVGVAASLPEAPATAEALLASAQAALGRAKLEGRNRVVVDRNAAALPSMFNTTAAFEL